MKGKGRQLQVSLSCCTELDPFWSSAEFPSWSQTRKHFRYFVLIHLWCLEFGNSGGLFWTSAQVKMCWKRGAPGRGGSGSPFLACTNTFCPGPVLIQLISGVSISFLDTGKSEDAGGSPLESTSTKYLEIHLPEWIFFCYFLLFSCVLMTNSPSVGPSCWSFGGKTELWDLLCLVQKCWEVWRHHPTVQLLFHSHSFRGTEPTRDWAFELLWWIISIGNSRSWGVVWVSVDSCVSQQLPRCFLLTSLSFGECALLNWIFKATGGYFEQTCSSLHSSKFRFKCILYVMLVMNC